MEDVALHPQVLWAQRKDILLITICVEDFVDSKLDITEDKLCVEGIGGGTKSYKAELEFYDLVDKEKKKIRKSSRDIFITLHKKTPGPYWPRMTKTKLPYLKTDFNRWQDEDDSGEEDLGGMGGMGGGNLEQMMAQMGGGGEGFPGLDDLNQGSDDSDDEGIPDLEDNTPQETPDEKS